MKIDILEHMLVPKHEIMSDSEIEDELSDADFVKDQVRMAYEGMLDKSNIIKEKGGGSLYVERLGNPKYSGPVTPVNYHNNYQMMRRRGNGRR